MANAEAVKFNKSKFIRSQPLSMTPLEIVALAKKQHGQKLTRAFVSTVRSNAKRAKSEAKGRATVIKPAKATARKSTAPSVEAIGDKEAALRKLVLQVGVVRSRRVLESLETLSWN